MKSAASFASLASLLDNVFSFAKGEHMIYRGQGGDYPLLPGVARKAPTFDLTNKEIFALAELRRLRADDILIPADDWGLTTYAQHFGMPTRLLDWSHNPLVSIWFAIQSASREKSDTAHVYLLRCVPQIVLGNPSSKKVHEIEQVWVIDPPFNNDRIRAQAGCFTVHPYTNRSNKYLAVDEDALCSKNLLLLTIPESAFARMNSELDALGVNANRIYADFAGLCNYVAWRYLQP